MENELYITQTPYYSDIDSLQQKERNSTLPIRHRPLTTAVPKRKLNQSFPSETYYEDKTVKPGLTLFKNILQIEEKRVNGEYDGPILQLNLPETIILNDNSNSMIYSEHGKIKIQPYLSKQTFMARLKIDHKNNQKLFPCALHSTVAGIEFTNSILMNNEMFENQVIPRSQGFICRRFILPFNHTPNLFRLFYISRNSKQLRKNYAYKMMSNKPLDEENFKKKHRLIHHYLIDPSKEQNYSLTTVNGKALQHCETMAASLVQYLQKGVKVKISEIVLDFIIDEHKELWLFDIKSVKSSNLSKLWELGNEEELKLLIEKNNHSQMCKLCGVMYSRHQLEKLVTNKLISKMISHLKKRGIMLNVSQLQQDGLSYVCSSCYEVIVAEYQLINVQKQFSKLLNLSRNISTSTEQRNPLLFAEEDFTNNNNFVPTYKAWRLFFYIDKIKNHKTTQSENKPINLQMKFKHFKEYFSKQTINHNSTANQFCKSTFSGISRCQSAKRSLLLDKSNVTILHKALSPRISQKKSKVIETATTVASKISNLIQPNANFSETYSIQKVKLYMFYTKKQDKSPIFENTQLQFVLNIANQRFSGRSLTLQALKNKETCQRHSSQIFLFDSKLSYCNLEVTVGLICDGQVSGEDIDLVQIDGICYPSKSMICGPLPQEWMEVFTNGEQVCERVPQLSYEDIRRKKQEQYNELVEQLRGKVSF